MTDSDLLLEDGMWVTCEYLYPTDRSWERCEAHATTKISAEELAGFGRWSDLFPRAVVKLYPSRNGYLCTTHAKVIRECQLEE